MAWQQYTEPHFRFMKHRNIPGIQPKATQEIRNLPFSFRPWDGICGANFLTMWM